MQTIHWISCSYLPKHCSVTISSNCSLFCVYSKHGNSIFPLDFGDVNCNILTAIKFGLFSWGSELKRPFILLITIVYSEAIVTVQIDVFARTIEPFTIARINYAMYFIYWFVLCLLLFVMKSSVFLIHDHTCLLFTVQPKNKGMIKRELWSLWTDTDSKSMYVHCVR